MQCFNLANDPFEQTSLDQDSNEIFGEIKTQLMLHIKKAGALPWQPDNR